MDYRNHSCMQPVKDQGECGSCLVFSSTALVEFNSCVKTGKPVSLRLKLIYKFAIVQKEEPNFIFPFENSEQQVVDCYGNDGCAGGWQKWAWQYIAANGGVDTESSYPYTATV